MIKRKGFNFQARGHCLELGHETCVMGILNVTPDSFSGDGQLQERNFVRSSIKTAVAMAHAGARIIDVGGESTRPGAALISTQEEIRRVLPVVEALRHTKLDVLVSVDTSNFLVTKEVLKAGAHIINVVRGLYVNESLLKAVARNEAGIILMHMRGNPKTMQLYAKYNSLIKDILLELKDSLRKTLQAGIKKSSIIIDPGIGFSKMPVDNFSIIKHLGAFKSLGFPILIGPSRKSFIGHLLGVDPSKRLSGTIAAVTVSVLEGAHIVRVHDCYEIKQAVQVTDAVLAGGR